MLGAVRSLTVMDCHDVLAYLLFLLHLLLLVSLSQHGCALLYPRKSDSLPSPRRDWIVMMMLICVPDSGT